MQALYSGVFSENPISWIKILRLGVSGVFSGGESISKCFVPALLVFCIVLIGIVFPKVVARVACRDLVDFLVAIPDGVIFWFCRFGEGELFSSDVDDRSSSFSGLVVFSVSVWRLIPLEVCRFLVGFPSVRFPSAFLFVGLVFLVPCPVFSPDLIISPRAPFWCPP